MLIVGREHPADIIVNLPIISGSHLEITVMNNEFMVRDLDSTTEPLSIFLLRAMIFIAFPPKESWNLAIMKSNWNNPALASSSDQIINGYSEKLYPFG